MYLYLALLIMVYGRLVKLKTGAVLNLYFGKDILLIQNSFINR